MNAACGTVDGYVIILCKKSVKLRVVGRSCSFDSKSNNPLISSKLTGSQTASNR